MTSTPNHKKLAAEPYIAIAAIAGLLVLAFVMFVAMLAGSEPHPPAARGPYLGAIAAMAVVAVILLAKREPLGRWVGMFTALAFIPATGPQKFWTEPQAVALAPLIAVGSLLIVLVMVSLVRARDDRRHDKGAQ